MAGAEFDDEAAAIADAAGEEDLDDRIAAACRGSGNPAALAWLAEGLGLRPGSTVVDLGAGLCGPAAWLVRHHRCRVVGADPAAGATEGAGRLFDVPVLRSSADAAPLRDGTFDAAVVLGVLSVVPDPVAVLREAARVARRLGVLEWCSTEAAAVRAGGSCFPTPDELDGWVGAAGWDVGQSVPFDVPVPSTWADAAARAEAAAPTTDDEQEVADAIDGGRLRVQLLVAAPA